MLPAGAIAPDFELVDMEGRGWSLDAARAGGPVLLVFFKISCPTCQFSMPFVQRLAEAGTVVAISQDDAAGTERFRQRFGISMRTLIDRAWSYPASNAFRIGHVPAVFLVEPDGRISMAEEGFSRGDFEALGERFGVRVFREGEAVPLFRPG